MTTGSIVRSTVQGMAGGLGGGSGLDLGEILDVTASPNGHVTGVPVSGVAWDSNGAQHYMYKTGTTWIKLGSIS